MGLLREAHARAARGPDDRAPAQDRGARSAGPRPARLPGERLPRVAQSFRRTIILVRFSPRCPFKGMKFTHFLAVLTVIQTASAQSTFTKPVSDPVMLSTRTTPAAFADFNRDGWLDLFLGTFVGAGFAYTNNGDGSFTRITNGVLSAVGNPTFGAAWGDFDNDGWPDLLVGINNAGSDILLRNSNGVFSRLTAQQFPAIGANGNDVAWADYDNDGFLDVFVANSDQNDFLLHNESNGSRSEERRVGKEWRWRW